MRPRFGLLFILYCISHFFKSYTLLAGDKDLVNSLASTENNDARVTLSGYLRDASNGEALIGAAVYVEELQTGTISNTYGFYSLSLPEGEYTITFSYVGYQSISQVVDLRLSQSLNIELQTEDVTLNEVVVSSTRPNDNVEKIEMSTATVNMVEVKQMPQLMGEVDVIRSIQMLPGVTTVGEGASGFNVRGGNIDENLVLLDEAPVYNASHVFGFFSVFNADAIKDMKIYKGGIPAIYGGRLSSVLDVRQKEGNMKSFAGNGGIGLISSRLMFEGPIKEDKSSFMISGRRSYADIFTILSSDENIRNSTAYFYDLNAKVNYVINDNNRVFLSGYFGRDVLGVESASMDWGNKTATLRWNHLFNDRLFSNLTAVYSHYDYALGASSDSDHFNWRSNILNTNIKADFSYFINPSNTLEFGVNTLHYRFKPGDIQVDRLEKDDIGVRLDTETALEPAIYISNEQKVSPRLGLQYGLRYSRFYNLGKGDVYIYSPGQPKTLSAIVDTVHYEDGEVIQSYDAFEPRISAKFTLNANSSLKASYNRMAQYIHLVSNTTAALPTDVWTPSGRYIKPAKVDQYSLGYFRNFKDNTLEFSAEAYYKQYHDLLDYKDGAELIFNRTLETEVLEGEGRAYGLELLLRKQKGNLTGWIGYTLAKTERKVPGIRNGEYYPSNYDKLHDLNVVATYSLNEKWTTSASFTFMSGRPLTPPNSRYEYEGITVPNFENRNSARGPAYHRIDLSATYEIPKKLGRKWESSWTFGIYNVYARKNAFSVYFRQNEENPAITEAVRYSVFGTIIPSVTYNFKF